MLQIARFDECKQITFAVILVHAMAAMTEKFPDSDSEKEFLLDFQHRISQVSCEISWEDCQYLISKYGFDVLHRWQNVLLKDELSFDTVPFGNRSIISLFTLSYNFVFNVNPCDANFQALALYNFVVAFIQTHLQSPSICDILEKKQSMNLPEFLRIWNCCKKIMKYLNMIFSHMDKSVIEQHDACSTLVAVFLINFKQLVFSKCCIFVRNNMIELINSWRDDLVDDKSDNSILMVKELQEVMNLCAEYIFYPKK